MWKIPGEKASGEDHEPHERAQLAFVQHRHALQRFLTRRISKSEDVNDLLQEVFIRMLSVNPDTLVKNPQAYLYGIAGHVVREFVRRKKRSPVNFDSEALDVAFGRYEQATVDHLDGASLEQQLREVLSQLPPTHLKVLIAERRDGLTVEQIAEKYGLSSHTVRKYIVQALIRIREVWDE